MNKFLACESVDLIVNSMLNKNKKLINNKDMMDYEKEVQLKNNGDKVDFNLNNINDVTELSKTAFKSELNKQIKNIIKSQAANEKQSKSIDIEQLKKSTKRKSKRILKRIDKLKSKLNFTDEEAINLMIKNRKSNKIVNNKLSLEDYIKKENDLKNKLKVS